MGEESRSGGREFQLETRHLAAIIVLIALLCITSFMLGRWVERQAMHDTAAGVMGKATPDDLSVEDVNRELTYFHTLEGGEKPPDVRRPDPVRPEAPADVEGSAPAKAATDVSKSAPAAAPEGDFMIQVMATKDLSSAIAMRQKLVQRGYDVEITEGTGASDRGLRKVRVGPYATRREAEQAARRLEKEAGVRTWIP